MQGTTSSIKNSHILGVILVIAVILFGRTSGNEILYGWDDGEYIENPDIRDLSRAGKYFNTYYLGMYQPLSVLSIALNFSISGEKATAYHALNILLHLVNILLLYFLILKISGKQAIAGMTAFLFAVHPVNAEAVGWISARSTLLFTLFYLLAFRFYLHYIDRNRSWPHYLWCLFFFTLSLLSKSMAMTFPLVLVLYDWYRNGRITWKGMADKAPFLVLSVLAGLLTLDAARSFGHIGLMQEAFTPWHQLFILTYSVAFYIVKAVFPANLSAIYAFPETGDGGLPPVYYLSALLLILIAAGILIKSKLRREAIFGGLFFLISISVVLPSFWSRKFLAGDRYGYLAFIGIFYVLSWLVYTVYARRGIFRKKYRGIILAVLLVYAGYLLVTTGLRTAVWSSTRSLLTDAVRKDPGGPAGAQAHYYLGSLHFDKGRYNEALKAYNKALTIKPRFPEAYNDRGILYGLAGKIKRARQDFNAAIRYDPENAEAYYNRGFTFRELGDTERACSDWQQAITLGSEAAREAYQKHCRKRKRGN